MKNVNNKPVFIIALILIFHTAGLANSPTAQELLDKYAATQKKIYNSFIIKCETVRNEYRSYTWVIVRGKYKRCLDFELRFDGKRYYVEVGGWGNAGASPDYYTPREDPRYECYIWDGKQFYTFNHEPFHMIKGKAKEGSKNEREKQDRLKQYMHITINTKSNYEKYFTDYPPMKFFNCLTVTDCIPFHDPELEGILRKAEKITVLDKTQKINDSNCIVLEAFNSEWGRYKIWFDAAHDYHIAKMLHKADYHSPWAGPKPEKDYFYKSKVSDVRFEKIDDIWVPVEMDTFVHRGHPDKYIKFNTHHKLTKVLINPDHDALGSFVPKFDDGLSVRIENYEGEDKFYWQKGLLVDKAGKTVDLDSLRTAKPK